MLQPSSGKEPAETAASVIVCNAVGGSSGSWVMHRGMHTLVLTVGVGVVAVAIYMVLLYMR
jgi:hypothetical protein